MGGPTRYVFDPTEPLPKRWRDKGGNLRLMAGPVEGYVMLRRPRCAPFVITVRQLLNAEKHPYLGPFSVLLRSSTEEER